VSTLTEQPADAGRSAPQAGQAPRSPGLRGRLSTGHLLMLLAGAVAALANYAVLTDADDTIAVLVAADTVEAGERLDATSLATAQADPSGGLAKHLFDAGQREAVAGSVATGRIEAGEPLRSSDVAASAAPHRQRAMSVPVDATHAVGGQLRPGDRVDVIETDERGARYLATDARVLAVASGEGLEGLQSGFSLTIAVNADAALRLAEAAHQRQLDVVRSTGAPAPSDGALAPSDGAPAPSEADSRAEAATDPGAEAATDPGGVP
jgi:Flp pilus assembly protein CpaB